METKQKKIKNHPDDKVIRVHKKTYDMIRELKGKMTFDDFILNAITFTEGIAKKEHIYVVGDKAFSDLIDARGESILRAVKQSQPPKFPTICIPIGEDNGA